MATVAHTSKSITNDFQKYKEKINRRSEGVVSPQHGSSTLTSNGSLPKRYQSVFTEGTPLATFGIKKDENDFRTHSPPNHIQPAPRQRPLKPVKEFLTSPRANDQRSDNHHRSSSQTTGYSRTQTDATVQNVNAFLTKTLNKLRPEPSNSTTTNTRTTQLYGGSTPVRPITSRSTSRPNTNRASAPNFPYQVSGSTKGPLPTELITKRPISTLTLDNQSNTPSNNRFSSGNVPFTVQQSTIPLHNDIRSTNPATNARASTPFRVSSKTFDNTDIHQIDGFKQDTIRTPRHELKDQVTPRSTTSYRVSSAVRSPTSDNQPRSLPEVSVNPHIQSSVQKSGESSPQNHDQIRTPRYENHVLTNINTNDKYTKHHIQVEPKALSKRTFSSTKSQQIIDVQPNITVQQQQSTLGTNSTTNILQSSRKDPFNEAYIEREKTNEKLIPTVNVPIKNDNDSTSTLIDYDIEHGRKRNSFSPPGTPVTRELNRIWKKQRNKCSFRSPAGSLTGRKILKANRPPGRLKNYDDETNSETTATETHSKDDDMARLHGLPPSDLGSDAWSDLTSEFSDTKFRKHPNIRTSTPNMTRQSSSQSSKEVGQIRKQLTDLQIMYNDLLKLLDIDIESVRSSQKSSTSSQADRHHRRHRFRKVMPVTSIRHSNLDMREVNQRFTRLETSIVTLAESIAKLSAQIQMQRVIKDDVNHLRQEVAELRQQLHHSHPNIRQQPSTPIPSNGIPTISQQTTRLISPNIQRLAAANSTNPLNISTSYHPSSSTIQRSGSLIDPRQARKIEQFFGTEAMLRYFLSLLNYEEYAPILEREKIGIYELPYVNERKLQSLGIPYGPCARIIYEAQQYFISLLTLRSSGVDV